MSNKLIVTFTAVVAAGMMLTACAEASYDNEYGVYLSDAYDELPEGVACDTLVIDAQYYTEEEIDELHQDNGQIYSYLNLGAIEDFRDYYQDYADLALGSYENWDEESWMDVADPSWQSFLVDELAQDLAAKGVDGFFVDNVDVYYNYPEEDIYDGVTTILTGLKDTGLQIIINGGDVYVTQYLEEQGDLDAILDGVNQESVYTAIDWDTETFRRNDEDTQEYYESYLSRVAAAGKDTYVLEYATDPELVQGARKLARQQGYILYISDSLELD